VRVRALGSTLNLLTNKLLALIEAGSRFKHGIWAGVKVVCTHRSRGLLIDVLRYFA